MFIKVIKIYDIKIYWLTHDWSLRKGFLNFTNPHKLRPTDSNGNIIMTLEDYPLIQNVKKKNYSIIHKFWINWGCYRFKNDTLGWRKGWINKEGIGAVWTHQGCLVDTWRSGVRRRHGDPAGGASHARHGGGSRKRRGGRWHWWCGDEGGRGKTEIEHRSYPGDSWVFLGYFLMHYWY